MHIANVNCFRFRSGNLWGSDAEKCICKICRNLNVQHVALPGEVSQMVCAGYEDFDFRRVYQTLFNFMTVELSAFYFDIRTCVILRPR